VFLPAAEAAALGAAREGEGADGCAELVEGVIDLAFREGGGWVIADYKTGVFDATGAGDGRLDRYRRQVELYAACWTRVTGEPVRERVLVLASEGREIPW